MATGDAYATAAQLATYLGTVEGAPTLEDADRLLLRASETLDAFVLNGYDVDATTGLPTDADTAEAMQMAACAQVEFWLSVGETHDVQGTAHHDVSAGGVTQRLFPQLAPRAKQWLRTGGLLGSPQVGNWSKFFVRESGD